MQFSPFEDNNYFNFEDMLDILQLIAYFVIRGYKLTVFDYIKA